MAVTFNPFTGNLDFTGSLSIPDPLTVNNLTVNTLLTAGHIHGSIAGNLYIHIKNADTAPLEKGTPFYISGTVGSSDRVEVKRADADDLARGPAIGLIENTLAVNGEGNGIIIGEIYNYDTSTSGWTANQPLYVSTSGTLTATRPTTGYKQIVGYVGRVHALTGTVVVNIKEREISTTAPIAYDAATQTVSISAATTSADGSMSAADKAKLDSIAVIERDEVIITTVDGVEAGTVTLPGTAVLLSIQSSKSGWFRLYNSAAASTADASRLRTEDPLPGSGVLLETVFTSTSAIALSPTPVAANMESPATNVYPYRFTNDGAPGSATITLTYLILEA